MQKGIQKLFFFILLVLWMGSLCLSIFLGYHFHHEMSVRKAASFQIAGDNASAVSRHVNTALTQLQATANRIAKDLSSGVLKYNNVTERLQDELKGHSSVFGMGIAFERDVIRPNQVYSRFFRKNDFGKHEWVRLEDTYDYTNPNVSASSWYLEGIQGECKWLEPFFEHASQTWMLVYTAPFFRHTEKGAVPAGIVFVTHSLDTFTSLLKFIDSGENGFSYLLSKNGTYVIHPNEDFAGHSIFPKSRELNSRFLNDIGNKVSRGESFHLEGIDPNIGETVWVFHYPIPETPWSVGAVFDKTIGQARPYAFVRSLIWLILSIILFVSLSSALTFRVDRYSPVGLWSVSLSVSSLFLTSVVILWLLVINYPPRDPEVNVLVNQSTIEEHLARVNLSFKKDGLPPPISIPTGIMLETIGFVSTNQRMISGYVWQKYPLDLPKGIEPGALFPDVVDEWEMEEVHRVIEGNSQLIVWFFRAPLRQEPSVKKFPLDEATVKIQISTKSLTTRLVLVPDLNEYKLIIPNRKPGLVDKLVLQNWIIDRSFFSYRYDDYNACFGSRQFLKKNVIPELYFNVVLHRFLLSPFVAYGVTMLSVAALLFGVLLHEVDASFTVLAYCASLFFVVTISHVGLRSELNASQVVYLESGFILLYIFILFVAVNSILYYTDTHKIDIPLLKYKDNLMPRLLYWPFLSGAFFAVSLAFLVPPPVASNIRQDTQEMAAVREGNKTIKIGVLAPFTGRFAQLGEVVKNTMEMVSNGINEKGGLEINGQKHKIKLILEDNASDPQSSVAAATRLIAQHDVAAIIGPQVSSLAIPTGKVANDRQTPMISPGSSHPDTTRNRPWVFRIAFIDPLQGPALAGFVRQEFSATRVAILFEPDSKYSKGIAEGFRDEIETHGGRIVAFESFHTDKSNFSAKLKTIKKSNPDILFIPHYYQTVAPIIRQARKLAIDIPIVGSDGYGDPMLLELCGKACEGIFFSTNYAPDIKTAVAQGFLHDYENQYGAKPFDIAALTYDAFRVLLQAIRNAGSVDKLAVRDALAATDSFTGVTGTLRFDNQGNPIKCIVIVQVKNGEFTYYNQSCPDDDNLR